MNKAIRKYCLDINMFNIPFSLIIGFASQLLWGVVVFCTVGILIGYLGFKMFKNNEYYMYYNLGYTKANLLKKVWMVNVLISILIVLIFMFFR